MEILVIILAAALAVFLILAIVVAGLVIHVLHTVRRITDKAEKVADSAENVTDFFRDATGPLTIIRVVRNIAQFVQRNQKKGKK